MPASRFQRAQCAAANVVADLVRLRRPLNDTTSVVSDQAGSGASSTGPKRCQNQHNRSQRIGERSLKNAALANRQAVRMHISRTDRASEERPRCYMILFSR